MNRSIDLEGPGSMAPQMCWIWGREDRCEYVSKQVYRLGRGLWHRNHVGIRVSHGRQWSDLPDFR